MSVPAVSIVIPVHNAMPYLLQGLDSVLAQTIGTDRLEVIAVDDGSTDGSGEALDDFAKHHPDLLRVLHQEACGTPSIPRNIGLDLARGEYVFFLDADDYFGPEALERMVAMADEHGSDVVLGRMSGVGRGTPSSMFKENQPRADLYSSRVYWTLGAWKLFRRSLLVEHGIRFPEERRRGEDQAVTSQAYIHARNISVVADYDCYYFVQRDDGLNLTSGKVTAPEHLRFTDATTLDYMAPLVGSLVPAGPERDYLMKRHFEVEGPLHLGLVAWLRRRGDEAETTRRWNDLREHVDRWYTPGVAAMLAPELRLVYHLVALDDLDGAMTARECGVAIELVGRPGEVWAALPGRGCEAGPQPGPWIEVTDAVEPANWLDGVAAKGPRLRIAGTARLRPIPTERLELHLEFRRRGGGDVRRFPLDHEDGIFTFTLDVCDAFGPMPAAQGVWDVFVAASIGDHELAVPYGLRLGAPLRWKPSPRARCRGRFRRPFAELRLPPGKGLELEIGRLRPSPVASLRRQLAYLRLLARGGRRALRRVLR
jgi:CDP-glycerol glycerophosphotransferase